MNAENLADIAVKLLNSNENKSSLVDLLKKNNAARAFFENNNKKCLCIGFDLAKEVFKVDNQAQELLNTCKGPAVVVGKSEENDFLITTMRESVQQSLYNTLNKLYEPNILKENVQVEYLVESLEKALSEYGKSPLQTLTAERRHWENAALPNAASVLTTLDSVYYICEQLSSDESAPSFAEDAEALMQELHAHLSLLQQRYAAADKSLKEVLWAAARVVLGAGMRQLRNIDLWKTPYLECQETLALLLTLFHAFGGSLYTYKEHAPKLAIAKLAERLESVLEIRKFHFFIVRELGETNSAELGLASNKVFRCFEDVNIFQNLRADSASNAGNDWKAALATFNEHVQLAESQVGAQIVSNFRTWRSYPQQHRLELLKNETLFARPSIREILGVELDFSLQEATTLVKSLLDLLKTLDDSSDKVSYKTKVVKSTQILNQLQSIEKLIELCKKLGHGNASALENHVNSLVKKVTEHRQSWLSKWIAWAQKSFISGKESAKKLLTEPTLQMDKDTNLLIVKHNPELYTFITEYRQLNLCDISIPGKVLSQLQQLQKEAHQVFRNTVHLKQLAQDYNAVRSDTPFFHAEMLQKKAHSLSAAMEAFLQQQTLTQYASSDVLSVLLIAANECARLKNKLRHVHEMLLEQINVAGSSGELLEKVLHTRTSVWETAIQDLEKESGINCAVEWRTQLDEALVKSLQLHLTAVLGSDSVSWLPSALPAELIDNSGWTVSLLDRQLRDLRGLRKEIYRCLRRFLSSYSSFTPFSPSNTNFSERIFEFPSFGTLYSKCLLKVDRFIAEIDQKSKDFATWETLGAGSKKTDWLGIIKQACVSSEDFKDQFTLYSFQKQILEQRPDVIQTRLLSISTKLAKASINAVLEQVHFALITSIEQRILDIFESIDANCDSMNDLLLVLDNVNAGTTALPITEILQTGKSLSDAFQSTLNQRNALNSWNALLAENGANSLLRQSLQDKLFACQSKVVTALQSLEEMRQSGSAVVAKSWSILCADIASLQKSIESGEELSVLLPAFEDIKKRSLVIFQDADLFPSLKLDNIEPLDSLKAYFKSMEAVSALQNSFNLINAELTSLPLLLFKSNVETWDRKIEELESIAKELTDYLENQNVKLAPISKLQQNVKLNIKLLNFVKSTIGDDYWVDEHYNSLFSLIGTQLAIGSGLNKITIPQLTLGHLLPASAEILAHENEVIEINNLAASQATLRQVLNEVGTWIAHNTVPMTEFIDSKGQTVPVLSKFSDVLLQVTEQLQLLNSIKDLPRFSDFKAQAASWESQLVDLEHALQLLQPIQRKWVYLEPIFGTGTSLIPAENAKFSRVDSHLRSIWQTMFAKTKAGSQVTIFDQILGSIDQQFSHYSSSEEVKNVDSLLELLEKCEKALRQFLQEKRDQFPRFYFISDEDLLEIWGQSGNPNVVQAHLRKLFAGVAKVVFDGSDIIAMESIDGEQVPLYERLNIKHAEVHVWLKQFSTAMQVTLKQLVVSGYKAFGKTLLPPKEQIRTLLTDYPGQVASLLRSIFFTEQVESTGILSEDTSALAALQDVAKNLDEELFELTNSNFNTKLELQRKNLITDLLHFKSVLEQLIEISSNTDKSDAAFQWSKQLRYYFSGKSVKVKMCDAEFDYSFEYQGNSQGRLVHTQLTDKCYLVLTQAMKRGFGGNPFGPAGTGKTESVKALGQALGRQVLVFNCDEGLDFQSMTRCFTGIIQCGAWGCFDEFNRLDESVLSTISSQIGAIQAAVQSGTDSVSLDGSKLVPLHPNTSIFVTLNPAGKNYGGRSKLPDNLKQLLRSVAMSAPNLHTIIDTELASHSFKHTKILSGKFLLCIQLCQQLCSKQRHYDWGLRAIKANLLAAGSLLSSSGHTGSYEDEEKAILKALSDGTLSKLTKDDGELFCKILADIFGESATNSARESLDSDSALAKVYEEFNLTRNDDQDSKINQLLKGMEQRMGIVLLGESGTGKSSVWKMARRKLELETGNAVHVFELNPKSMPRTQLLGEMDYDTREWTDGVLTRLSRKAFELSQNSHIWIVADGDVDPEWIESLNSVLDDNRLLTIPNGERIQFTGNKVHFIFETDQLHYASPATVSRMAMIYFSKEFNPWALIQSKWPAGTDAALSGYISSISNPVESCRLFRLLNIFSKQSASPENLSLALCSQLPFSERELIVRKFNATDSSHFKLSKSLPDHVLPTKSLVDSLARLQHMVKTRVPIIVMKGSKGTGKNTMLACLKNEMYPLQFEELHLHSKSNSTHIIQWLKTFGHFSYSQKGRCWIPKSKSGIVCVLKHIERLSADQYGTIELFAFLQQWNDCEGFYDVEGTGEFVNVDHKQCVFIATSTDAAFLSSTCPRLEAKVAVLRLDEPSLDELKSIVSKSLPISQNLIDKMVRFYEKCYKAFPNLVSSRDVVDWAKVSSKYDFEDSDIGQYLSFEAYRRFYARMPTQEQRNLILQWIREDFGGSSFYFSTLSGKAKLSKVSHLEFRNAFEKDDKICYTDSLVDLANSIERAIVLGESCHFLVGGNGSGRTFCSKQVALLTKRVWFNAIGGTLNAVKVELKKAVLEATVNGMSVMVHIPEHVLLDLEHVCELLNDLILSQTVGNLYTKDEWEALLTLLAPPHKNSGFEGSILQFMQERLKQNMHVVINISPEEFIKSKSLMISWLSKAGQVTFIGTEDSSKDLNELASKFTDNGQVVADAIAIHKSQLPAASIKQFLGLLETFGNIYREKKLKLEEKLKFYKEGLVKLSEASSNVAILSAEAQEQQIKLEQKKREADVALEEITASLSAAADSRQELKRVCDLLDVEKEEIFKKKEQVEAELASIEPLIREAKDKVGEIKSESLSEIRSLRAPPPVIKDVLDGVLRLMGIYDTSWNGMKQFLGKRTVKEEILNFDARKIDKSSLKEVQKLLSAKPDSFDEVLVKKASVVAAPLASWVKANVMYSSVLDNIAPLEANLANLQNSLEKSESKAQSLRSELDTADAHVAKLRTEFGKLSTETASLEAGLASTTETLAKATQMLEKLTEEGQRWSDQHDSLVKKRESIGKVALLAASFCVYPGFKPNDGEAEALTLIGSEVERISWRANGLPGDSDTLDNGAKVLAKWNFSISNTLLLIDPNGVACEWIMKQVPKLELIAYGVDPHWQSKLELAVRFGKCVLVSVEDSVPPIFVSFIKRLTATVSGRSTVAFGDKIIDFHPSFKIVLSSKNEDFSVHSALKGYILPINFGVTLRGLSDLLLSHVLQHEDPKLEAAKREAVENEENLVQNLEQLQESLLQALLTAQGNILQNNSLISSLDQTKTKASVVSEQLELSRKLQHELDGKRLALMPLARIASHMYFSITRLRKISSMYNFSLSFFVEHFKKVLSVEQVKGKSRLEFLTDELARHMYVTVARALFQKDHLMWGLYLLHATEVVSTDQLGKFLSIASATTSKFNRTKFWIESWDELKQYVRALSDESIETWIQSDCPELHFPNCETGQLSFVHLSLLKGFRADRFQSAAQLFLAQHLGSLPSTDSSLLADGHRDKPVLFVTAPGTPDLTLELRELAKKNAEFVVVPMGQNQGPIAVEKLRDACSSGKWLFLQNLHLAVSWLPVLQKELLTLEKHESFRLFLSTEPLQAFPPLLISRCSLVAMEAAPGLRNSMERICQSWASLGCFSTIEMSRALFNLAWFHSVICERRSFVPQGWTQFYEFWQADLKSGVDILLQFQQGTRFDWKSINTMLHQAVYGGRIDNPQDSEKLQTLLDNLLSDSETSNSGQVLPQQPGIEEFKRCAMLIKPAFDPLLIHLPLNIDRSMQQKVSEQLSNELRTLVGAHQNSGAVHSDQMRKQTGAELADWSRVWDSAQLLELLKIKKNARNSGPFSGFIERELMTADVLVKQIANDMRLLLNFSTNYGAEESAYLKELLTAVLKNRVPDAWTRIYDPSNDDMGVAQFLQNISTKVRSLADLLGKPFADVQKSGISLDSFFNPATLLNVLRQISSRDAKCAIDELEFANSWSANTATCKSMVAPLPVHNLLLQGARFSGKVPVSVAPSDPSFQQVGTCYIGWIPKSKTDYTETTLVPLYTNSTRSNFVTLLSIQPGQMTRKEFVLSSVSFFVSY